MMYMDQIASRVLGQRGWSLMTIAADVSSFDPQLMILMQKYTLHAIPELPNFLLIVVGRECTSRTKCDGHRRSATRLHDARNCRTEKRDTVSQCKFSAIVLVLLNTIA